MVRVPVIILLLFLLNDIYCRFHWNEKLPEISIVTLESGKPIQLQNNCANPLDSLSSLNYLIHLKKDFPKSQNWLTVLHLQEIDLDTS
ncbi:unnamed protein product [Tenebrio molitor]|nr:unnamed protein product [Tenebrio molitor]